MKRLTEYIDGRYIAVQKRVSGNIIGDKDCYNRLGEYENTGLTPEEIKHLHKLTISSEKTDTIRGHRAEPPYVYFDYGNYNEKVVNEVLKQFMRSIDND